MLENESINVFQQVLNNKC